MRDSNWPEVKKGTHAGTVKRRYAFFIRSFVQRWVIKCGMTNIWGHRGGAKRSSYNNSNTTSMAAGGIIHSLAALRSRSSNMLSLVMVHRGDPPNAMPLLVFHQLWTHAETRLTNLLSALWLKGMNDSGSLPAITSSVKLPRDRPSTPKAFICMSESCLDGEWPLKKAPSNAELSVMRNTL